VAGVRRPALLVVCAAVFVDMLGFGIILPLLPYQVQDLGGTGVWVGAVLTAYAAAQFVSAPVLGALSDRFGRRPLLLAALAGSAVSLALTGIAPNLPLLLAARLLAGLFGGAIAVGQAYVVDLSEPAQRTRALGLVGASIGLGFVFGPAIGAGLADLGFAGVSFVAAGVAAANLVAGFLWLPRTRSAAPSTGHGRSVNRLGGLVTALRYRGLRRVLGAIFVATLAFVAMEATFALLGAARFDLGPRGLGLVFTGVGVVMAIVQGGLVGRLADRFGDRSVAVAGAVLLGAGLAVLPFSPQWITYVALGVVAVGQGLLTTTSAALISSTGGPERGQSFGAGQSASAAARAIGPLVGGAVYDAGAALPYVGGAALCLLAALLLVGVRSGSAEPTVALAGDQPQADPSDDPTDPHGTAPAPARV
jgi:DHA1 family tetracycline resistance protein-like MFS transporter